MMLSRELLGRAKSKKELKHMTGDDYPEYTGENGQALHDCGYPESMHGKIAFIPGLPAAEGLPDCLFARDIVVIIPVGASDYLSEELTRTVEKREFDMPPPGQLAAVAAAIVAVTFLLTAFVSPYCIPLLVLALPFVVGAAVQLAARR